MKPLDDGYAPPGPASGGVGRDISDAAPRVLLLARGVGIEYRVLRCAAAAGAAVHVLGHEAARNLARSRYAASFTPAETPLDPAAVDRAVFHINRVVGERAIGTVLPADGPTTALLAACRDRIEAPCFPGPSARTFALLNDKWRMMQLCAELGLPHPVSRITNRAELEASHRAGALRFPCIAKPIGMQASIGVKKLRADDAAERIREIDYDPVLVQDFVPGQDICISTFCRKGQVIAEVTYTLRKGVFKFAVHPALSAGARKIAARFAYEGILELDARISPEGEVAFLECNPRFWYNMDMAMLAGWNFVELGLDPGAVRRLPSPSADGIEVPNWRGLVRRTARPWSLRRLDFEVFRYYLADPVASLLLTEPRAEGRGAVPDDG